MKKKYWIIGITILFVINASYLIYSYFSYKSLSYCPEDCVVLDDYCCWECIDAFVHSPISVEPEVTYCSHFLFIYIEHGGPEEVIR